VFTICHQCVRDVTAMLEYRWLNHGIAYVPVLELVVHDFDHALDVFKRTHQKHNLPGHFGRRDTLDAVWPAGLPRTQEMDALYLHHTPSGIKMQTGLSPMRLHGLDTLQKGQIGYRWTSTSPGLLLSAAWPTAHVVIMDEAGGGNPIIAVTDAPGTPVLARIDAGTAFPIAGSMADFFLAMAALIDIVYGEFDVFDVGDDDGLSEAFLARLTEQVEPILGKENCARFVDCFYG